MMPPSTLEIAGQKVVGLLATTPKIELNGDAGPPGPAGATGAAGPAGAGTIMLSAVAGTNTVTATGTPAIAAYPVALFVVVFANANTGAVTLNVDDVGARDLLNPDGAALASGAYAAGVPYVLYYNGANFRFLATF